LLGICDLGSRSGSRITAPGSENCDTSLAVEERQLESVATATHDPLVTKSTEVPYAAEPIRTVLSQLSQADAAWGQGPQEKGKLKK